MTPELETKLRDVFHSVLAVPADDSVVNASQLTIASWDSVAHVTLMLAVEGEFGVTIDLADQLELTTYAAILAFLDDAATGHHGA